MRARDEIGKEVDSGIQFFLSPTTPVLDRETTSTVFFPHTPLLYRLPSSRLQISECRLPHPHSRSRSREYVPGALCTATVGGRAH